MPQPSEFMDVADSDFLSNKELDDDDSEFDFDFEKYFVFSASKKRLFGRKRPLYVALGAGKIADIILWRKKKISASVLAGVTFMWILFKRMDYTLLSFICDSLFAPIGNSVPLDPFKLLHQTVTLTLGAVSVIGNCFTAATLFYIVFVIVLIGPAVYERHEDIIDIIIEKTKIELNNLYAELMKKFFWKFPLLARQHSRIEDTKLDVEECQN